MQRILVTGGDGLLAYQLKQIAPTGVEFCFTGHAAFDLANPRAIRVASQQLTNAFGALPIRVICQELDFIEMN